MEMAVRSRNFGAEGLAWSQAPSDCDAVQSSDFPNPQENGTGVAGSGEGVPGAWASTGPLLPPRLPWRCHCFVITVAGLGAVRCRAVFLVARSCWAQFICSFIHSFIC